jgi:hypothetical protein
VDVAVAQYLGEQSRPNLFFAVDGHDGHSSIVASQHVMAAPDPDDLPFDRGQQ